MKNSFSYSERNMVFTFFLFVSILLIQSPLIGCSGEKRGMISESANTQIAAGRRHSVALKKDGTVWAWGENDFGQLGNGTNTGSGAPILVKGLRDVISVATGTNFTLALKNDGTVWAWGDISAGQLSDKAKFPLSNVPVQVSGVSDIKAKIGRAHV